MKNLEWQVAVGQAAENKEEDNMKNLEGQVAAPVAASADVVTNILASYGANIVTGIVADNVCDYYLHEDRTNGLVFMNVVSLYNDNDTTEYEAGDCLVLSLDEEEEHLHINEAPDWLEDYYVNLPIIGKFKLNKELDFYSISLANVRDYIVLPYTDGSTQKKVEAAAGGLELSTFVAMHKDDAGIDGIISNIREVQWFADKVVMLMDFASGKNAKSSNIVGLNLDFYDPNGSYKVKKATDRLHVSKLDDTWTHNVRIVYKGSSIAVETFVFAAAIWELATKTDMHLLPTYKNRCADVLDASGSKASRNRYKLSYDISLNNLELVFINENCRRNSHKRK